MYLVWLAVLPPLAAGLVGWAAAVGAWRIGVVAVHHWLAPEGV